MPTLKTPLFGSQNNRSFSDANFLYKDQFAKGCVLTPVINNQTKSATYYVEKRSGAVLYSSPNSGQLGYGIFESPSTGYVYTAIGGNLYRTTPGGGTPVNDNCGAIVAATNTFFSECTLSSITYILVMVDSVGWYLPSDAIAQTSYTGNRTAGSPIVSAIASTSGCYIGQKFTGTGFTASARILTVDSGTQVALTENASSGAGTSTVFTKEPVAKIIDADFPSNAVGMMSEIDGYLIVMTLTGRVYNSDLNSLSAWQSSNYYTCSAYSDLGVGAIRYKNQIMAFGNNSIEFLYNTGNASGSPFSSSQNTSSGRSLCPRLAYSITLLNGVVYWLGVDKCIYRVNGFAAEKLNQGMLPINSTTTKLSSHFYNKKNYLNIYATVDNTSESLSIWYSPDDNSVVYPNFQMIYTASAALSGISCISTTVGQFGKIFRFYDASIDHDANPTFLDDGVAFTMSIQIGTDMGTLAVKFGERLSFLADVQASGTLDVSWSDNDGTTFSTAISVPLTSIEAMYIDGIQLGSWDGTRIWKFEHSANTPCRIKGIEIDYEVFQ